MMDTETSSGKFLWSLLLDFYNRKTHMDTNLLEKPQRNVHFIILCLFGEQ